jgi:YD repeat-containing protein
MKHKIGSLIKIFFLIFISNIAFGQTENDPSKFIPNIIPPSPNAYGLGTYGNTPIGLFTGSQNVNIPLYTYKTANLEVPITMLYNSNGVKVDEISSNVGQSWNLSFGGVITRVVRDKPDEDRGEYPIPISITETMGRYSPPALEFYQYIAENDVDTEADLFSFNFGKYSGKFVFDNEGKAIFMPAQDLQIEQNITSEGFNFIVTAPDGVKYFFNDKEVTSQRIVGSGHSIPNITVSSWYLSKIIHPKGDVIQFVYDDAVTNYIASKSQTFRMLYPRIQYDAAGKLENYSPSLSSVCDHTITLSGKSIKSIKSSNPEHGEVLFSNLSSSSADVTSGNRKIDQIMVKDKTGNIIENIGFTYATTTNKRIFLDKIQFKDVNQNYQFEYEDRNSLPQRLSYSQDHWGYFNNKNNVNIVPKGTNNFELESVNYNGADKEPAESYAIKGMLKKIIYPTKGYTEFNYESNTYYGTKKVYPSKTYKSLSAVNTSATNTTKTLTFINLYTQDIPLVAGVSFDCLDQDLNIGKNQAYVSVYDNTAKRYTSLRRSDNNAVISDGSMYTIRPNTESYAKNLLFSAELNHEYIITLQAVFNCTASSVNLNYYPTLPVDVQSNIITGGVRVSQTSDYSINKSEPVIKKIFYAKKDDLTKSSGNKGQDPYYLDRFRVDRIMESPSAGVFGVVTSKTFINLSSSSLTSLFDTGNSNIYYKYVTISYGSGDFLNGGEEHEFIVHRDGGDGFVVGNYDIRNTPLSNLGWDNGLLKKVVYFNKNLFVTKAVVNEYEERPELRKEAISYNARKNYEKIYSGPVVYECTEADLTKRTPYRRCVADHKHLKLVNSLFIGYSFRCIAPGNDNQTIYIQHPCYGEQLPKTITNLENIDNISIVSYKNIGFWHYLKSSQEVTYDSKGENPVSTTTTYNYRGINHVQLSSQTRTNSKNEIIETKYFNAKDFEMSNKPFVTELADRNILSPLDKQTFNADVKLSEQLTIYNNLLLAETVYSAKFPNTFTSIDKVGNLEKKITYDQYDDKGNLLQYTPENGVPVCIIWGYNKTQPVAKIENASYSQVSPYVSNIQDLSDTGSETVLLSALNTLRANLPNAMVTTYTYIPLVGVSTITDPKGQTTTYTYDSFGRLEFVKDNKGNILSENQYNYKH